MFNTSIVKNPETNYKHCRHDVSFPCNMPSEACRCCKVNVDRALSIQDGMNDYWKQMAGGNSDVSNWRDE